MTQTQPTLHVERTWIAFLIAAVFGLEILIQGMDLIAMVGERAMPRGSGPATGMATNAGLVGLCALALFLLWDRSRWTRVAVWTWALPVVLTCSWMFWGWMKGASGIGPGKTLWIGGRGLVAGTLAVVTYRYVHIE
ncbi:MAG: hypothetical protein ABEL97_06090 [Salinibacter sp.]